MTSLAADRKNIAWKSSGTSFPIQFLTSLIKIFQLHSSHQDSPLRLVYPEMFISRIARIQQFQQMKKLSSSTKTNFSLSSLRIEHFVFPSESKTFSLRRRCVRHCAAENLCHNIFARKLPSHLITDLKIVLIFAWNASQPPIHDHESCKSFYCQSYTCLFPELLFYWYKSKTKARKKCARVHKHTIKIHFLLWYIKIPPKPLKMSSF